jgi:hypothetical protein
VSCLLLRHRRFWCCWSHSPRYVHYCWQSRDSCTNRDWWFLFSPRWIYVRENNVLWLKIALIDRCVLLEWPIVIICDTLHQIECSTGYTTNRSIETIGNTLVHVASVEAFIALIERNKTLDKQIWLVEKSTRWFLNERTYGWIILCWTFTILDACTSE